MESPSCGCCRGFQYAGRSAENLDMPSLRHAADNAALDATIRQSCTAWTGALAPVPAYRAPATLRRIDSHQVPCRYGFPSPCTQHLCTTAGRASLWAKFCSRRNSTRALRSSKGSAALVFGSSICGSYGHEISMSADNGVFKSRLQVLSAEQEEVLAWRGTVESRNVLEILVSGTTVGAERGAAGGAGASRRRGAVAAQHPEDRLAAAAGHRCQRARPPRHC